MARRFFFSLLLFALLVPAGCGSRRAVYSEALSVVGPFPVSGGLVYLDRTLDQMIRLRVSGRETQIDRIALPPGPRTVVEALDGNLLAVLCDDTSGPGVILLQHDSLQQLAWLPLGESFDRLAAAPGTAFGVAYFSSAAAGTSSGIRNLNQVQVIDFAGQITHQPILLSTGGQVPRGIDFTPAGSGDYDNIVALRVDNGLVLIDMADASAEPLWVRFTNAPGGLSVPSEVVFGPFSGDGGYIYVRLQGSDDVLSIHLDREGGRLRRNINFLNTPAGSRPTDLLVVYGDGLDDKVFTVFSSAAGGAALLDANSIQTAEREFSFSGLVDSARILVSSDGTRELVAVYKNGASRLFVVDPRTGEQETIQLQDPFYALDGPPGGSQLVVFHEKMGEGATAGLRVVSLDVNPSSGKLSHRVATYALEGRPAGYAFAGDVMLAALDAGPVAFRLELGTGVYKALELARDPLGVGLVPASDMSYVLHAHPLGGLTLIPLQSFDGARAELFEGFLLQGLLDPR
ncbi:MAG TPA: hypothetical protein VM425_01920 [Myxococcota bacterium]|nr:hypothetical protein [Myxococcota bacterium]